MLLLTVSLALLAAGCNPYPQNIFERKSEFAIELDDLFYGLLIAAGFVFVTVEGALIYAAVRYRRRDGDRLPPQTHGNTTLEILWTAAPAVVLAIVLFFSTRTIFATQAPAPADSMQINVIGHRFWWEFQYPDLGVVTANEVHMPIGQTVNFAMRSADVIHSFWIPALGGKRDVLPSHTNYLWWTPNATGTFPGQCAELCGQSHAQMRARALVQTPEDFEGWVAQQRQPAVTPPPGSPAALGADLFQQRGCAACHTVSGTAAAGKVGPDLTHFGSRTTVAAGVLESTPENIAAWLADPPKIKPDSAMPKLGLSPEDTTALVAYLQALK